MNIKIPWRATIREYALTELVGKTIATITVIYRKAPCSQLWMTFTDGTCYEWYSWNGEIAGSKYLDRWTHEELTGRGGDVKFDSIKEQQRVTIERPNKQKQKPTDIPGCP